MFVSAARWAHQNMLQQLRIDNIGAKVLYHNGALLAADHTFEPCVVPPVEWLTQGGCLPCVRVDHHGFAAARNSGSTLCYR